MVMRKKIAVTGANGQLGMEFRQLQAQWPQYEFVFLSKDDLPIDNAAKVNEVLTRLHPDYLVNCAAYTAVDKAETDAENAFAINANGTGLLAQVCNESNISFVHVSTDYVFDGTATVPYKETDATHPLGVYGASKLEGEQQALSVNPATIIIRTSWVYSSFGKNFVKTMLRLMSERDSINVVKDQLGSPTYAADLANAIMQVIASGTWQAGIYHYSNEGTISWYDFANAIKELTGSNCTVHPIPTSAYPTPAKRPAWSVFDKTKIKTVFHIDIPGWKQSLTTCIEQIKKHHS